MSNTRDFKSLGVWATNATTTIPSEPVSGTPYRNSNLTTLQNKAGEPYGEAIISADFNQKMYIISSFTDLIDKKGIVGWSNLVDYMAPALVWGSDGYFYEALTSSGPSSTIHDPVDDDKNSPIYWRVWQSSTELQNNLFSTQVGTEGSRLVGYNKVDVNGGVDEPITVKSSLDELFETSGNLNGLTLQASGFFSVSEGKSIVSHNGYNIYNNEALWSGTSTYRVVFDDSSLDPSTAIIYITFHRDSTHGGNNINPVP